MMRRHVGQKILLLIFLLALLLGIFILVVAQWMRVHESDKVLAAVDIHQRYDAILVLGAKVYDSGRLSPMLRDRVQKAVQLYQAGMAPVVIMSGDRHQGYDEPGAMAAAAEAAGVPKTAIVQDPKGFNTAASVARAKDEYHQKRILIVSQTYHLYRALYLAEREGLQAIGVPCEQGRYGGEFYRGLREQMARFKDWLLR